MRLVAIGRAARDAPEMELFARYAGRLKPALTLTELPHGVGSAIEIKRREADAMLAALPAQDFVVALDESGLSLSSAELSARLTGWRGLGKPLSFVIGGAEGFDATILARADAVLSLGRLTWPHMMVRMMLAEQLFRAQSIATNHPYHRAGRP
jgi:23S rRNA (pseudouridine1915-N3)-methyltransferase